ncbi:hypothetical protein [Thermoflexus sp.]|uniref:hypothetical protein n=1 Tax=Thermoflexus sp. TaxID=1969742 RepID=UPI0035E413BB
MHSVELVIGLLAFGFFLVLWVILPHRLHRPQHRMASAPEGATAEETPTRILEGSPARVSDQLEPAETSLGLRISPSTERRDGVWGVLEGEFEARRIALPIVMERIRTDGVLQERYTAWVGGVQCQHTTPYGLKKAVEEALQSLTYAGQLPVYSFALSKPTGMQMAPVYRLKEWQVMEPEGPILSAGDLKVLRERVADLWECPAEALEIYRLSEAMSWIPPVAVLTDPEGGQWTPVFLEGGCLIYPDGLSESVVPVASGSAWEALLLGLRARIRDRCIIDLSGPLVREARESMMGSGYQLRGFVIRSGWLQPVSWPIYLDCGWWIALLDGDGEPIRGILASDRESLRGSMGWLLAQEGSIRDPTALRVGPQGLHE